MPKAASLQIAVIGIDIGKNSFHMVGHDSRGAITLCRTWSRGQIEARLANLPPCLIGMEACVGAHPLARKLATFAHHSRLMPAMYVWPYAKGQKNDFNDAEAAAEAVQRPTMKFVATKTADQLDLQALHRVRERLVSQRTGIINQIHAFMLERGIGCANPDGTQRLCRHYSYEIGRARISMVVRSTRAPNRDLIHWCKTEESASTNPSCDARPDHT